MEPIEITIDDELLAQVNALLAPRGLTIEDLINAFFRWAATHHEEAVAYLREEMIRQGYHPREEGKTDGEIL